MAHTLPRPGSDSKAAPSIRLLTFNTWLVRVLEMDLAADVEARARCIPGALAATGADVIALQEVWSRRLRRGVSDGLVRYGYNCAGAEPDAELRSFTGSGLLIASRWPIEAVDRISFSGGPACCEGFVRRGALRARIQPPDGEALDVVDVQLGAVRFDPRSRRMIPAGGAEGRRHLEELTRWIQRSRHPGSGALVVMGDLSLPEESRADDGTDATVAAFAAQLALVDSYRQAVGGAPARTFDARENLYAAMGNFRQLPREAIDYILADVSLAARISQSRLVFREPARESGAHLSDHYGVLTSLRAAPAC